MTGDHWLTASEAAEHVRCNVETLHRAAKAGELVGWQPKPRGHWRFTVADLDAWIRGERPTVVPIDRRRRLSA